MNQPDKINANPEPCPNCGDMACVSGTCENAALAAKVRELEQKADAASAALDGIAVALVGSKLPFSGDYSFKHATAAESMRAIVRQLEAKFSKQSEQTEEIADRLRCLMGKLSNNEPRHAEEFAKRIADGESAAKVVREAISELKAHYNYRCELEEESRRELADVKQQLSDAQQAANDAQRSYRDLNTKSIKAEHKIDLYRTQNDSLRGALERMLSTEGDWEDGQIGVGHWFREIAREALDGKGQEAGWIACSERLPEVGVEVLVYDINDGVIPATRTEGSGWRTPSGNASLNWFTHWLPMPAPPAAREEKGDK